MKFFCFQILICILFSFQQNVLNDNDDFEDEEKVQIGVDYIKENKELNLDDAVSKISKLFDDKINNMNIQINNIINNTLYTQEQISKNSEQEQEEVKEMLIEIKKLKQRYKRNMIFSYIIASIILFTFFIFYCNDSLKRKRKNNVKYKNLGQLSNENTQLDIF